MMKSSIVLSLVVATKGLQLKPSELEEGEGKALLQPNEQTSFEYQTKEGNTLNFGRKNKDLFDKAGKRTTTPDGSPIFANPWQNWCTTNSYPYGTEEDLGTAYYPPAAYPGIMGTLDQVLRDQFLDPENIKRAALFVVGTIILLTGLGRLFEHPSEHAIDQVYFGLAMAPMVLMVCVLSKLRFQTDGKVQDKVQDNDHPQNNSPSLEVIYEDFPNELYDPTGTVFGKVVDTWSPFGGTNASVSQFLSRTPLIAWCYLFMIINSVVAEMIRAFYDLDNKNVWGLPEIEYHKTWILFSIVKNIGWLGVILTTHFHGNYHVATTAVAIVSAIMQTFCITNVHPDWFWKPYYRTVLGVAGAYVCSLGATYALPAWRDVSNHKLWKIVVHVIDTITFPFEWSTAILVYILLFNEMTVFALQNMFVSIHKHLI